MYCCAQVCAEKPKAVEPSAVIRTAKTSVPLQTQRGCSIPVAESSGNAIVARTAVVVDLNHGQRADGMMLDIAADHDHVHREHYRAAEYDGIAAIESTEAFRRYGEQVKSRPARRAPRPKSRRLRVGFPKTARKMRHEYHARTSDEGCFRWRGEFQSGGLKRVGRKHKEADLRAGPDRRRA